MSAFSMNCSVPSASTRKGRSCLSSRTTLIASWNYRRHWTLSIQWSLHLWVWETTCPVCTKQWKIATYSAPAATSAWTSKSKQSIVWNWSSRSSPTMYSLCTFAARLMKYAKRPRAMPSLTIKERTNWHWMAMLVSICKRHLKQNWVR